MINLNSGNYSVTEIQFFDYSREVQINENGEHETFLEYSANIIINDELIIQLSGNEEETHTPYVPGSDECFYNNEKLQDWASENIDIDEVKAFLEASEIENNFHFLQENS